MSTTIHKTSKIIPADYRAGFAFFKRPTKAKITKGGESQKTQLEELTEVLTRDTADNYQREHGL